MYSLIRSTNDFHKAEEADHSTNREPNRYHGNHDSAFHVHFAGKGDDQSMDGRTYIAIDLKSFYASVECVERHLDPLTTNLVVADATRTEKTICLAVSPSMKSQGIPGRPRLFEVVQKVQEVNAQRRRKTPGGTFTGASSNATELESSPGLMFDYIVAPPRMALYIQYSTRIYGIYLSYVAPEDIHVYSIDEVFMDVTDYLNTYKLSPHELAMKIILDVLGTSGITATAGIGTNLYLCKVAMDIQAKHIQAENGVRIAELDEMGYRKLLWDHRPLTDFWRVGRGYAAKLEANGLYTMGDVARCSLKQGGEDLLYRLFGVNAELLIDHAWGWEPCTIREIKAYKPDSSSLGSGQVLHCPYDFDKAKLIVREMTDVLVLDLVDKGLVTDQIELTIGYDTGNLTDTGRTTRYNGQIVTDFYGRPVPKPAHGTTNLGRMTSSTKLIIDAVMALYDKIVDVSLLVRRVDVTANHLADAASAGMHGAGQLDLFADQDAEEQDQCEKRQQKAILAIKKKFGKNAILKGMDMEEGATTMDRNRQIGGHKA